MAPPPRPLVPKNEKKVSEEELRLQRRNQERQKREERQLKELIQGGGSDDEWEAATPLKSIRWHSAWKWHLDVDNDGKSKSSETEKDSDDTEHNGSSYLVQPTPNRYASHSQVSLVDDDDGDVDNMLLDSSEDEFYTTVQSCCLHDA